MRYAVEHEEETEAPRRGRGLGRGAAEDDREITLGTRSLLGIFFGLVLICGIFFGLGYSVGRVSEGAIGPSEAETTAPPATSLTKPSPQETVSQPVPDAPTTPDGAPAVVPTTGAPTTSASVPAGSAPAAATSSPSAAVVPAATVFPANPAAAPTAAPAVVPAVEKTVVPTASAGTLMVQVAAVSVPQDADILVAALRQHGYTAVIRREPEDQLLHVQIGPFTSRAQAQSMRGRLLADGYNAVIR